MATFKTFTKLNEWMSSSTIGEEGMKYLLKHGLDSVVHHLRASKHIEDRAASYAAICLLSDRLMYKKLGPLSILFERDDIDIIREFATADAEELENSENSSRELSIAANRICREL